MKKPKRAWLPYKNILRETAPPNDYGSVVLLWASTRMKDLLSAQRRSELVELLWHHQRKDGGWSLRTFSAPEKWGRGNRAAKLRAEPEFKNPPSDGHMTGLAVLVLREAGVPANDPRLQKGVQWLLKPTREWPLVDPLPEHRQGSLHHLQWYSLSAVGVDEVWGVAKNLAKMEP